MVLLSGGVGDFQGDKKLQIFENPNQVSKNNIVTCWDDFSYFAMAYMITNNYYTHTMLLNVIFQPVPFLHQLTQDDNLVLYPSPRHCRDETAMRKSNIYPMYQVYSVVITTMS